MAPGSVLRSYLEGKPGLIRLARFILRSHHFGEETETKLFTQLSNAAQDAKKTPQVFLPRVLDIEQEVIFTSHEENPGLVHDTALVRNIMKQASSPDRIREAVILTEMAPFLRGHPKDDDLMGILNTTVNNHKERLNKIKPLRNPVKVAPVGADAKPANTPDQIAIFRKEVQQMLEVGLNNIRQEVSTMAAAPPPHQRPRGCAGCRRSGKGDECQHCFKCGSSEHYARGCRSRRSENGSRLQPRDNLQSPNEK